VITRTDVRDAAGRIAGHVRITPSMAADPAGAMWFKCEYMQHTGSFKARGAMNRLLTARDAGELDPAIGVVAASGGNAGLAVAYAAARLGVPAEVWVPTTAPAVKVARLRALGATVVAHGAEYAEAHAGATARAEATGAVYCHAYDQPAMVAGAGTVGLELLAQVGDVDTVLVAVGGGGLIGGVTAAIGERVRIVAVEPRTAPTLHDAIAAGGPVDVAVSGVAADSLGARRAGAIAYAVTSAAGVRCVLVDDDAIVAARRELWARWRIAVEHGAAAAYAGLHAGAYLPAAGERVAIILCGANTDPGDLR
jgi:threonine dehydratase